MSSEYRKKFERTLKEVAHTIMEMDDATFAAELEKHKDGDIALMLKEESRRWGEYYLSQKDMCIDAGQGAC